MTFEEGGGLEILSVQKSPLPSLKKNKVNIFTSQKAVHDVEFIE